MIQFKEKNGQNYRLNSIIYKNSRRKSLTGEGIGNVRLNVFTCYIYCLNCISDLLCTLCTQFKIVYILKTKKIKGRTFLVVPSVRLRASNAGTGV